MLFHVGQMGMPAACSLEWPWVVARSSHALSITSLENFFASRAPEVKGMRRITALRRGSLEADNMAISPEWPTPQMQTRFGSIFGASVEAKLTASW